MATVRDQFSQNAPQDQEEENKQGLAKGGESSVVSSAPQGGNTSPGQQKASTSGRFTNIQSYINANKEGAQQLGKSVVSGLNKDASETVSKIGESEKAATETGKAIESKKQELTAKPEDVGTIGGAYQYAAPTIDVAGATQGVSGLVNNAAQAGSEAGRFGLLQRYFKKPSYTGGQQRLDSMLLGKQGEAISAAKQIGTDLQGQAGNLLNLVGANDKKVADLRKLAEDTGNTYYSKLADQSAAEAKAWQDAEKQASNYQGQNAPSGFGSTIGLEGNEGYYYKDENGNTVYGKPEGGLYATQSGNRDEVFRTDFSNYTPDELLKRGLVKANAGGSGYAANQFSDAGKLAQFNQLADLFKKDKGSQVTADQLKHTSFSSNSEAGPAYKAALKELVTEVSPYTSTSLPEYVRQPGMTIQQQIVAASQRKDTATLDYLKGRVAQTALNRSSKR